MQSSPNTSIFSFDSMSFAACMASRAKRRATSHRIASPVAAAHEELSSLSGQTVEPATV